MRASLAGAANRAIPERMRAWLSISLGSGLALLLFACATGNTSFTGTGLDEGDPDGATLAPKPVKQDGSSPDPVEDAAPPVDSSVAAPYSAPPSPTAARPPAAATALGRSARSSAARTTTPATPTTSTPSNRTRALRAAARAPRSTRRR